MRGTGGGTAPPVSVPTAPSLRVRREQSKRSAILIDESINNAARKLKRTREAKNLTLQQLADISGVSPSNIQKIETGRVMPSVAVMMKIARGLHKKIGYFLDDEEEKAKVSFVKKEDRMAAGVHQNGFSAQRLTSVMVDAELDSLILTLDPGISSGDEALSHRGEELVYVTRGTVTFTVDGIDYILKDGDSLHFKSDLPHSWENTGRGKAEIILICSLPNLKENTIF